MGTRQHRLVGVLVGQVGDRLDHVVHLRQQGLAAALAQHQGVGQVVDVLGGAGKVDELADRLQFGIADDLFLEEVLHRLDVMVGGALDVLDPLGVLHAEVLEDPVEQLGGVFAEGRYLGDRRFGSQRLQPADLHQHPVPDQTEFAEDRPQVDGFGAVAAVHGRDGGK